VTTLPDWQQRHLTAAALGTRWLMAAAAIFVPGVLVLLVLFQSYPSPEVGAEPMTSTTPPQPLPAALAATLAAKGRAAGSQSVSTLLDLADRGVLTVRELPRRMGARHYELSQVAGRHDLADHETEALTIAFAGRGDEVTLSKARARLARAGRRFSNAVNDDLDGRGLLSPERKAVRYRFMVVSVGMLFAALACAIAAAALIPRYEGWPFLLPLALAACAITGLVMAATMTPLSDAGLLEGARWRGFKRHLKELASHRGEGTAAVQSRWIVYAIALGLSAQWSRYLKKHPGVAPPWFVAEAGDAAGGAFASFVGSNAAGTSGAGAGGGAAAGGGGSGAG
jgi:hypothetical protein